MTDRFTIERLLPHQAPMILIDDWIEIKDDTVHTCVEIRSDNLFFDSENNTIPAYVGIEFMAQSIAAWSGYHQAVQGRPPRVGFLLGTRRYRSQVSQFHLGEKLDIFAEKVIENDGMSVFSCQIKIAGETIANAQLNAFMPKPEQLEHMLGNQ